VQVDDASRLALAGLARLTGGLSPQAFGGAWLNVLSSLATSPGRQAELARGALQKSLALAQFGAFALAGKGRAPDAAGTPYAARFSGEEWAKFPFNVFAQSFLTVAQWAREAVQRVPGADSAATELAGFTLREGLEVLAPDNYLPTNPKLVEQTLRENGRNLLRGARFLAEDVQRAFKGQGPVGTEEFRVGEQIAASPGKVVLRNRLMELIQYSPQTPSVYAEPVLIVPAWIMKYYILDLSAKNSLVRYLTALGHTVFMVSWKNPDAADRELSMDDYVNLGVREALAAIAKVRPRRKVHATGYCIGGTLLSIAAAELAARGELDRLASLTLFAAQTDFSEPGELSLFINPAQLAMLEAVMAREGVLDSAKMGGAFQLLRSYDLLWSPAVTTYLRGERLGMNDLMAWNADGTRMAHRMHTDYLHQLYLHNDLAEGRYESSGERLNLADVTLPMFVVGTETDHVAPWKSVYKVGRLVRSADYTFCLTSGGHNAGIISGPEHPKRRHRVHAHKAGTRHLSPEHFLEKVAPQPGSWWPTWAAWLAARSSPTRVKPPTMGAPARGLKPLGNAPGSYVLQR
jgi:polyhydroxyalkanoate synthase